MKKLYAMASRVIYVVTLPLSSILLHNSKRVRVLIICENKILLQRSSIGTQKWSVPGGGIQKNENPVHAAIRETLEETGVLLNESMLTCIGKKRVSSRKRWPMVDMTFYKTVIPELQKVTITRPLEILEARWFDIKSIPVSHSKTLDLMLKLNKKSSHI